MVETSLKVAAIQMVSVRNWKTNLEIAQTLIKEASANGANLIVLPEFFIQITDPDDPKRLDIAEELDAGAIQIALAQIAKECSIFLVAGTILIKALNGKYYNTLIVYNQDGEQVAYYNKIHLFKYADETNQYDESLTFVSGSEVKTVDIFGFRIGLSICYDLRFPELYRKMGKLDLILLPSAFTYTTGKAHWQTLTVARAIENQCYFMAVNQGGLHETGRYTYGHSMIINPWGEIMSSCEEGTKIIYANLFKNKIQEIRAKIPALEHRIL
jgi:nitrilase